MRKLLLNRIRTPDQTVLTSKHQHDFRSHRDTITGELYFTDGGLSYLKRGVNKEPYEDLSLYSTDSFEKLREGIEWGNYGKNGDEPLQYKSISNMSTNHIKSILSQIKLAEYMEELFEKEISFRSKCETKGLVKTVWEDF